jgi:peptidoglycan hydrolase-like protein with peptidoglycan-binding domain
VAQLQEALIQLGYLSGKADGNYGTKTVEAVRAFQKANGLTADGAAGEQTQRVLYGGNAKAANVKTTAAPQQAATATAAPATSGTLKVGSTGTDVQTLQQKLVELGYLKGSADGVFGNKTAAAVKAYQKASKLTADGVAGSQTLSSLNAVAANKNAASSNTAANTSQKTTVTPSAARVQYANWYEKVKSVARSYPYATVYDIGTGISWQVHIFSLGAHADYEPVTANDTARMEKVFGGNTWNPRAVWVIFSDGSIYIGSTHSMPHEVQHVRDNNFNGHSCLHFPRTQEQVTSIGPYATKHQETIDAGWAATQKMK